MNEFAGLLASDYGFKPSGRSAPMSALSKGSSNLNPNFYLGSRGQALSTRTSNSFNGPLQGDRDSIFGQPSSQKSQDFSGLSDILGGSARYSSNSETRGADAAFNFDFIFVSSGDTGAKSTTKSEQVFEKPVFDKPVFDKPVFDEEEDIFDGVPGLKSSSSKVNYDDVFSSVSSSPPKGSSAFDDLLGGFGKSEPHSKSFGVKASDKSEKAMPAFDDLLPGFGGSSPSSQRSTSGANFPTGNTVNLTKSKSNVMDDPFVVTGNFSDPLEEINKLSNSGLMKNARSVDNGVVYDEIDPFDRLGKSIPVFSSQRNNRGKERNTGREDSNTGGTKLFSNSKEPTEKSFVRSPDGHSRKKVPVDNGSDSRQTMFDMPTASIDTNKYSSQTTPPPSYASASVRDSNMHGGRSTRYEENLDSSEDVWLTVFDIPLFTQLTSAPPPSRPPPSRPVQVSKVGSTSSSMNPKRKPNEFSSFANSNQNFNIPKSAPASMRKSTTPVDELEDFATGRSQNNVDECGNDLAGEELEMNSAAAAMKDAMDRAEAKFRHAKEVRGRESAMVARNREVHVEKDDREREKQERWDHEQLYGEREEGEIEQRRLEREKERKEKERELRRLEKERERTREIEREMEREREKARQAVERATREARERAAAEARLKAERNKAEKAAVERANAEARERAERAAVQRAQAEARERAAAEAREREEKAAAERANAEAKEREGRERAAAGKAAAEARTRAERVAVERAAAEARERAAAAARASQQKDENDLESFFSMGQASTVPRPRTNSSNPSFGNKFQPKQQSEILKASSVSSTNTRKVSSTANIADDLSSIFGAAPSSGEFQEVEGESEERRRARLERQQRTQERVARALAEKNERDLQNQREQAERHRISETLDVEIKRWSAGKEGNVRALLSTMQYVLWPECGWQPVSLTDMITGASVKKVYRKATLCIHPDKVQQKGANLQQKYIAEKVFDLLKEAWNKFNSEELF